MLESRGGGLLRNRRSELHGRLPRRLQGPLRLRPRAVPARLCRHGGAERRDLRPLPVGHAAAGGRQDRLRLCRRAARREPQIRTDDMARKLRTLGFPRRISAIRRAVGRNRRRILERGKPGRHRKPRSIVVRPYLRQEQDFGGIVHGGRRRLPPLPGHDETAWRPLLHRGNQQHAAAPLHLAALRRARAGSERHLQQRIQSQKHLVPAAGPLHPIYQASELHASTGAKRGRCSLFHR